MTEETFELSSTEMLEMIREVETLNLEALPEATAHHLAEMHDRLINLPWHVNVYLEDRAWGGSEEGGWWFDFGQPEEDQCVKVDAMTTEELIGSIEAIEKQKKAWCDEQNADRRDDVSSILSEGRYMVLVEPHPPQIWPECTPHYE